MRAQLQNLFDITWIVDMKHEFIMLFSEQIALYVIGDKNHAENSTICAKKTWSKEKNGSRKGSL